MLHSTVMPKIPQETFQQVIFGETQIAQLGITNLLF